VELPRPGWFDSRFGDLLAGRDLAPAEMTEAVRDLMAGRVEPSLAASFLTALRIKGETAEEIAAAALVLREQMMRLVPVSGPVLDTCGTGGDAAGTFNVSTATAFLVAAAGVPVVKHGGRAVSSRSGSADVLRELGVNIELGADWAQRCLDRLGFAFCYAPQFHGSLKHVAHLRQTLGFRTLFNLLGPLANPASADYQLLGVGDPALLDPMAGALAKLGIHRGVIVCGKDRFDEVSLATPTLVRIVEGDEFEATEWSPQQFGLEPVALQEIAADGPAASARIIREVLANHDGPAKRIVLANAAAALWTADAVDTLAEGVRKAEETLAGGAARALLEQLLAMK
jgi:anthranilate phosphoribosyltransferase